MTYEERMAFRSELEHKARFLMEKLKKACAEPMGWAEMMDAADMLVDFSRIEKNMAKVHYYESERPHHEDKRY